MWRRRVSHQRRGDVSTGATEIDLLPGVLGA